MLKFKGENSLEDIDNSKKNLKEYQSYLDSLQKGLYNLSVKFRGVEYPHNFCNYSSVITYFFLLNEDKELFSDYCIRKIKVYLNDQYDNCDHWLIVHKKDGMIGKLQSPVIDMTIHQFDRNLKPGIIEKYPFEYDMVMDRCNHTRTLIRLLRIINHNDIRENYDAVKSFCSQINDGPSLYSKSYFAKG